MAARHRNHQPLLDICQGLRARPAAVGGGMRAEESQELGTHAAARFDDGGA